MKAVILAGGMGTRLKPLTFSIPKPLLPIGKKPILEIIITRLKKIGIKEFILMVGYKAEIIQTYFGDGTRMGVKIEYITENKPLGTAGPLSLLSKKGFFKKNETFLLLNGDLLFKIDIKSFIAFHKEGKYDLAVCLRKHLTQVPFGVVQIEGKHISGIEEKPTREYIVSTGIYLINSDMLRFLPYNRFFTMPEFISKLISMNKNMGGYIFEEGQWLAIDQIEHLSEIENNQEKWLSDE